MGGLLAGLTALWMGAALAGPRFTGEPQVVDRAQQVWREATACVGWDAPTADAVEVALGDPGPGRAGRAIFEEHVLVRVILRGDLTEAHHAPLLDQVLAHELGHAWFAGPPALAEGGAQLLGRCAVGRLEGRSDPGPAPPLDPHARVDLHTWANDDAAVDNPAGYAAAHGLAEQLVQVIALHELPLATTSWGGLLAELDRRGPQGEALSAAVRTDPLSALTGAWRSAAPDPASDPEDFRPTDDPLPLGPQLVRPPSSLEPLDVHPAVPSQDAERAPGGPGPAQHPAHAAGSVGAAPAAHPGKEPSAAEEADEHQ